MVFLITITQSDSNYLQVKLVIYLQEEAFMINYSCNKLTILLQMFVTQGTVVVEGIFLRSVVTGGT